MTQELYKLCRPVIFKEVIGQDDAVKMLREMELAKAFPHAMTFIGPSGCGKTTLARIVCTKLECHPTGLKEINAAISRGVDTIREIESTMGMAPMGGKVKCYIFDEAHKLTSDAQNGLLKMLEDTPKHVYFLICTTDPTKLIKTIRTRCTEIAVQLIPPNLMKKVITGVLELAKLKAPSDKVIERIIECSGGSARKAVVFLNQVMVLTDEAAQLGVIVKDETEQQGFDLVKALLWEKSDWKKIAGMLKELEDVEIEPLRQAILTCAGGELLKPETKANWAALIIDCFSKPFFDSGRAGFRFACFEVMKSRK